MPWRMFQKARRDQRRQMLTLERSRKTWTANYLPDLIKNR